ncbi:MAG: PEP-CTERM sorting domain-containing protein [Deltaproteobacteria bacterium]|nr:PEP-CTERM sorting domain-containing protein [Deltaproteobacteria bacterium]MBW2447411.1 PEP-CTERM sorting domain-containing protein [Deltaproteobacteria bacterium]
MTGFRSATALALAATFCFASAAHADLILGDFLGPGTGDNDSVAAILADFGLDVTMLARIEPPGDADPVSGTTVDGLTYFNFILNEDDEPAGGEWSYAGVEVVDLIAVKAGPNWGVWQFTPANTNNMLNMGLFNTLQLQPGNDPGDQRGFGDVTAYRLNSVPEPSVLLMMGLGLCGLYAGSTRTRF